MIHAVLGLVDKFDDVESVFGLHHLRQLPGLQRRQSVAERLGPLRQRSRGILAAVHGRSRVDRIESSQHGQGRLARNDALAHLQQTLLGALLGLGLRGWIFHDLSIDVLFGDQRQLLFRQLLIVTLDLARGDRDTAHHLALHRTRILLLGDALTQKLAEIEDSHMLLGLQFGDRALLGDHHLQLLLDARVDVAVKRDRIYKSLTVKQLLLHEHLQTLVHRIAIGGEPLRAPMFDELIGVILHFGVENRRSAHYRHHAIEHDLPFLRRKRTRRQQDTRRQHRNQRLIPQHNI